MTHTINAGVIRRHGYTPSQLLFGFNMTQSELDATAKNRIVANMVESFLDRYTNEERMRIVDIKTSEDRVLDVLPQIVSTRRDQRISVATDAYAKYLRQARTILGGSGGE